MPLNDPLIRGSGLILTVLGIFLFSRSHALRGNGSRTALCYETKARNVLNLHSHELRGNERKKSYDDEPSHDYQFRLHHYPIRIVVTPL